MANENNREEIVSPIVALSESIVDKVSELRNCSEDESSNNLVSKVCDAGSNHYCIININIMKYWKA